MTQLLVSVKNLAETALVLAEGVDIIDLKDPNVGALGALDLALTEQIVHLVNHQVMISATVGEQHQTLAALKKAIEARATIGVDIIKIAAGPLFKLPEFIDCMRQLTNAGIQLVAVFFADEKYEAGLLAQLQVAGFYGAMLDTQDKQKNLLQNFDQNGLHLFTQQCLQHALKSGLAGSLRVEHIRALHEMSPTYLGFRGGACEGDLRRQSLSSQKLAELKSVLFECNKIKAQKPVLPQTALHTHTRLSIVRQ